tara:strand:- start:963 stop:1478 length:516 start_codon:yes stop_codon:yes gene_type:complete
MNNIITKLPLVIFVILVASLFIFLKNDNQELNSVLIDKEFPEFNLSSLDKSKVLSKNDLEDLPFIINVWATWCITCRVEHPFLMQLKNNPDITVYGINYKDDRREALNLLDRTGNPFKFSIFDPEGRLAIDLGVYGAPETFLIGKDGLIKVRHTGALTPEVWEEKFTKYID